MTVINSNTSALRAQNGSRMANQMLQTAMARLSSGKRINSASDDAAGLAISNSMTSQITGMNQAIRNSNDGISLAQTADGALDEVTNNLQRIRELAVQSASGTYSDQDRANMQAEVSQLTSQISSSLKGASFNGVSLFDTTTGGTGTSTSIQVGSNSADKINIDIGNLDITNLNASVTTQADDTTPYVAVAGDALVGTQYTATDTTSTHAATAAEIAAAGTGAVGDQIADVVGKTYTVSAGDSMTLKKGTVLTGTDVSTVAGANSVMDSIDAMLDKVNTVRAGIGASESRLNSVVNNLTNNVTNLTDANSRISDADFSVETTNLAKAQILSQAATAMLAQANQSQQGVLKLLQ